MKPKCLWPVFLLTLTACEPAKPSERFFGTWSIKVEETLKLDAAVVALTPEEQTHLVKVAAPWMKRIRVIFKKNNELTLSYPHAESRHAFSVSKVGDDSVLLQLQSKNLSGPSSVSIRYKNKDMVLSMPQRRWVLERS